MAATLADHPTEKRHHWIVRATHWVNVVALTIMVGSGLRIFNAYPMFARKGETFCCWPWEGDAIPKWLTFGGGLSGGRNWHFAMMWVLAVNGAVYLAFIWLHGEWRDLAPRRGDVRDAWEMIKFYLFVRKTHPHQGKHNALQKGVYFALPWLGVLAVLTGIAIWKPVQLAPLTNLFGGYVWARYWHFLVMLTLVLLGLGHVFMVFAVDPQSLGSMLTGRYDESRSPEALNARPFLRARPKPVMTIGRGQGTGDRGQRADRSSAPAASATEGGESPPSSPSSDQPAVSAAVGDRSRDVDASAGVDSSAGDGEPAGVVRSAAHRAAARAEAVPPNGEVGEGVGEWDDILVTVDHPHGAVEVPLTEWLRTGPGGRPLLRPSAARRKSTGEPVALSVVAGAEAREARRRGRAKDQPEEGK